MRINISTPAGGGEAADPVAAAWATHAHRLARHFFQLQNRSDVHGAYLPISARRPNTRSGRPMLSYTSAAALTEAMLVRHFEGRDRGDLVGLHVSSPEETCRWVVVDVDAHDEAADPAANWKMALAACHAAEGLGLDVLLQDSNGKGGYHLWIVFDDPVAMADACRLGKWLVRDHADFGFIKAPETFPKRPGLSGKRIGNWVRLPGLHHTRDHWTRVWGGDRWLVGRRAIRAILAVSGKDVDLAAVVPLGFEPVRRKTPVRRADGGRVASIRFTDLGGRPGPASSPREIAMARTALGHLGDDDRDDYDKWLGVGMALRQLGEAGLQLWHEWSEASDKYSPEVLDEKWASIASGDEAGGAGLITLGSLFHWAGGQGWAGSSAKKKPTLKSVTFPIRLPKIHHHS